MTLTYLISILVIFGMLAGWIGVQHLARSFAARHPEFGPAREEGACHGEFAQEAAPPGDAQATGKTTCEPDPDKCADCPLYAPKF